MAEITCMLAANIRRQFFFVIATTANTRYLAQNFELICYLQRRVNARHNTTTVVVQDVQNGRTINRMVAMVKHCWILVQGRRGCRELDMCSRKYISKL